MTIVLNDILEIMKTLGAPAVLAAVVIAWLNRRMSAQDKRAEARKTESALTMRWMMCAGETMREMATAIKLGHCNGELSAAVANVDKCGQDLEKYLIEQNAQNH